jgi:ATP-dependent Clp protease ATP-binding subunit ClpC
MEACCCSSSSAPSASILAAAPDVALRRRIPAAAGGRTPARPLRVSAVMLATAVPRRRGPGVIRAVFERFTERAVKAVVFSQREARGMGDDTVAPHHLLLGLIAEDRTLVGFLGSGLRVERAREACRDALGKAGPAQAATGLATDVPFSAASKRVFEAAVEFSRNIGCNFISPEHIALGLFDLDDPTTNRILKRLVVIFCSILHSVKKLSAIFHRFWSVVYKSQ